MDARIEDVRQKSRKFSEPGRAELGARRREPRAEEDEEGAAPRPERATRNPQASVMRKVAQMREGLEATGAASPVPMMRLAVQREAGVERVPVVDVLALKSRSLVSEGERSSAKSLLEKRRQQERRPPRGLVTVPPQGRSFPSHATGAFVPRLRRGKGPWSVAILVQERATAPFPSVRFAACGEQCVHPPQHPVPSFRIALPHSTGRFARSCTPTFKGLVATWPTACSCGESDAPHNPPLHRVPSSRIVLGLGRC